MDWLAAWAHGVPCCARRRPGAEAPASAQSWPVEFADGLALLVPAGGWSGLTPARYYDSHLSRWVPIAEQQLRRGTFQKLFFERSAPLERPQIAPLTPDAQYLEGEDLSFGRPSTSCPCARPPWTWSKRSTSTSGLQRRGSP